MSSNTTKSALVPYSNVEAAKEAIETIEQERSGNQIGYYTRWTNFNRAQMRYVRLDNIIGIAGASGAGKSAVLNMLRTDFTDYTPLTISTKDIDTETLHYAISVGEYEMSEDAKYLVRPALNANAEQKAIFLHFAFEMSPKVELLRMASSVTGISFDRLLSSQGIKNSEGVIEYAKLSDSQNLLVTRTIEAFAQRNEIMVFNSTGNCMQIYNTAYEAHTRYPNYKIIIAIDHTLLSARLDEKSDLELQDNVIKMCVRLKAELKALIIPLTQLNSNIEDVSRRGNNGLHFPIKSDIYNGGQFFQGCDDLYTLLQPSSIGINEFGPRKIPTIFNTEAGNCSLIHVGKIKARYGQIGQLWLANLLNIGKIKAVEITLAEDGRLEDMKILPNLV